MKEQLTYDQIKAQFKKSDWSVNQISDSYLKLEEAKESKNYIIDQLNSKESGIRYIASMMIIRFEIQEAVETLIKRILDKDTLNSNGTMSFALEDLNCENYLLQIFKILATQSYETKCHAYNILSEQEFIFNEKDLYEMEEIMKNVVHDREKHQIFENETFEMVNDGFKGFNSYLKNENPADNK